MDPAPPKKYPARFLFECICLTLIHGTVILPVILSPRSCSFSFFRSFDSRWISSSSSSRLREFLEGRFRLATIHQSPAPYFFTFHMSHSLWEVRKHGTVARSSNLTHLNSGQLPERGPFSSIHPDWKSGDIQRRCPNDISIRVLATTSFRECVT